MYVVFGKIPSLLWNGRRNRDEKNLEHNSKFQQMIRKLLVLLLCLTAATATAKKPKSSASKKAESSAEKPKESDYDKLFKEKHTVADGMFRLHDVKGKLYFEIPDSLFGREMLLGSTISEVSDNAAATTGSKSDYPLHVVFTRNDRSVQLRTVNCENITDEPVAGLDVVAREQFYDVLLADYAETGRTFIISTHIIEEAAGVFEDIIFIDNGRVIETGNCESFVAQFHYVSGRDEDVARRAAGHPRRGPGPQPHGLRARQPGYAAPQRRRAGCGYQRRDASKGVRLPDGRP